MGYDENQAKKPFLQSPFYLFSWGCTSIGKRGICEEKRITIYNG